MAANAEVVVQEKLFEDDYITRTYSTITTRPDIALTELIANAWDSGASYVRITIPEINSTSDKIVIEDDGTGMTEIEFTTRWMVLGYNRLKHQGDSVSFPPERQQLQRKAYGRNGIGRHGMFCFSDTYTIETWKDGRATLRVLSQSGGESALNIIRRESFSKPGHGTILTASITKIKNYPIITELKGILSVRFLFNPEFSIFINDEKLSLEEHADIISCDKYSVNDDINIEITVLDSTRSARKSHQHGIAFWVGGRLVGEPSWIIDGENLADGRTRIARRVTIIVKTDSLFNDVEPDWTSLKRTDAVEETYSFLRKQLKDTLNNFYKEEGEDKKLAAVRSKANEIKSLSREDQHDIETFVNSLVDNKPNIDADVLELALNTMITIKRNKSSKELLSKIVEMSDKDILSLNSVLETWSVEDIVTILDEVDKRILTVEAIERLMSEKTTDELHVLHPLVLEAKWLFGVEFDTDFFASNRWLYTTVKNILGIHAGDFSLETPKKRADIIVFDNSSICGYAAEDYNPENTMMEINQVLIIELKKGGFEIGENEMQQATHYANELYFSNALNSSVIIHAFVVGNTVNRRIAKNEEKKDEHQRIFCKLHAVTYEQLVSTAKRRLFGLRENLENHYGKIETNTLIEKALAPSDVMQVRIDVEESYQNQ